MGRVTVKGSGVGGGERSEDRKRRIFSSPPPSLFPSFALAPTLRVTIFTLKDGRYNKNINKRLSPTQNTPALQATVHQGNRQGTILCQGEHVSVSAVCFLSILRPIHAEK